MPEMFLVGGAVRDKMLGLRPKDYDYTVIANSFEEMKEWLMREKQAEIFLENPEFGTIRARIRRDFIDEVKFDGRYIAADFVLARKDGYYSDGRRPDSTEPGTLLDDLTRRDFTVNAMAEDESGKLIDPFGGKTDLESKLLRTVRQAEDTLSEDALRVFRAFRFKVTKGFRIEYRTKKAMKTLRVLDQLNTVSVERIREELLKCFAYSTGFTLNAFAEYPELLDHTMSRGIWFKPTLEAP